MADIAEKFGLRSGSIFWGTSPPKYMTGKHYMPTGMVDKVQTAPLTTTATRLYYTPMFIPFNVTFAGAKTRNHGTGDTGEVYRVGLYADDGATGGPGTRLKDFGEVTLDGSAAVRTLASSVAVTGRSWVWVAVHMNAATAMHHMGPSEQRTDAGYAFAHPNTQFGSLTSQIGSSPISLIGGIDYVDTTYGALAATAVAPTASTNSMPSVVLYV